MGRVWDYFMRRKPLLLGLATAFLLGGLTSYGLLRQTVRTIAPDTHTSETDNYPDEVSNRGDEKLGDANETGYDSADTGYLVQDALATAMMIRVEIPRTGGHGEFQDEVTLIDTVQEETWRAPAVAQPGVERSGTAGALPLALAIIAVAGVGIVGYFTYQHFMR